MDFAAFLSEIRSSPDYADQAIYVRESPPRLARLAEPAAPLVAPALNVLRRRGIGRLYTHQAQAIDALRAGHDALVVTGTASGKSLCYTLPIIETLSICPSATSLLLFPTKALCQDQYLRFCEALDAAGVGSLAGVIDGDTPSSTRRRLRDEGAILFTNPDMLHAGIMPQHPRWANLFSRLRFIVLDELHVYSGLFGSNAGNLLRRVFRLCEHYGSSPQIVASSATIGNPLELAKSLTGRDFTLIDDDGSPAGRRTYVFWNPPQVRSTPWRSRRSANVEAQELMALLVERGVRTITFSKAKMTAEMIHRYVCETLRESAPHLVGKMSSYRGGFLADERREIERRLFGGELLGVSTTRALELGIDVGGLDASILVGYPGTLASFFQQSGRGGRSTDDALAILVGLDTPVNQYIMRRPDYIFGRPVEQAVVDPDNPFVILGHLRCTTQELALPDPEVKRFGPHAELTLEVLESNQKVKHIGGIWYHSSAETPQHEISLRTYSDANVVIEDAGTGTVIGQVDKYDAQSILHPEAIYMHQGDTYRVLSLDLVRNIAVVKREDVDYYTQPLGGTDVHHIDNRLREKPFGSGRAYWGEVTAHFTTYAYEKVRFYELDALSQHGLDLPTFVLETMAFWIVPPEPLMEEVRRAGLDTHSGLRGIGYATRMILPLFITCDTLDFSHTVGSVNSPWNAVFIYERYPHGLGFTEKAYGLLHEILPAVLVTIVSCPCAEGCPCCVGKPLRQELVWNPERGESSIPSKTAAVMILKGFLGDGTNLHAPDVLALTQSDEGVRLRLERMLRRRLERMREPQVSHPIEARIETRYPDSEKGETLSKADVERRSERRRDFDRKLRRQVTQLRNTDGSAPAEKPAPTEQVKEDKLGLNVSPPPVEETDPTRTFAAAPDSPCDAPEVTASTSPWESRENSPSAPRETSPAKAEARDDMPAQGAIRLGDRLAAKARKMRKGHS